MEVKGERFSNENKADLGNALITLKEISECRSVEKVAFRASTNPIIPGDARLIKCQRELPGHGISF